MVRHFGTAAFTCGRLTTGAGASMIIYWPGPFHLAGTCGVFMLRHLLLSKIHRATVTRADLHYAGSITLDPLLIRAAGFVENEKIDIYDVTNGARLSTYVIPGKSGSGEVGVNGAAAHLVNPGDLVILAAYAWMTESEAESHRPRVVHVDENNRVLETADVERN